MNPNNETLKKRLDVTLYQICEMLKQDLYENVVVSTVMDWFESGDSILELNESIKQNVKNRWPFMEQKVRMKLMEFDELTRNNLQNSEIPIKGLNSKEISDSVSSTITVALGTIGATFLGTVSGGAGTAIIASGPLGWVIGAVIGAGLFFGNKEKIEKAVSGYIVDKKIPPLMKQLAKGKVASQLKLNESKFEQDVFSMLSLQLKPVYDLLAK